MPKLDTLPREYTLLHVVVAICAGTLVLLGAFLLCGWHRWQGNKATAVMAQLIASTVVGAFYGAPVAPRKTAPLSSLEQADKKLRGFSASGLLMLITAFLCLPHDLFAKGSALLDAVTVVGTAALVIIPASFGFHTLVVLIARHVKPVPK